MYDEDKMYRVAALVLDNNGKILEEVYDINLKAFTPSSDKRTLFNFEVSPENVRDTSMNLDFCCPAHDYNEDISGWITSINDTLPRVSCDIGVEAFIKQ